MQGTIFSCLAGLLLLAAPILVGCSGPTAEPTPQANPPATLSPSAELRTTSTLTSTMPIASAVASLTPGHASSITSTVTEEPSAPATEAVTATAAAVDVSGWVEHRLEEAGAHLSLPPDWTPMRLDLARYFARPTWVQSEIDPAAFALLIGIQGDVPYDLPGLTETQTYRLSENEPGPLTHEPITIGGHEGVAFWGFAHLCMDAFVPADGVVHAVTVSSYLCQGAGAGRHLKPEAKAMLDSIRFFPPNPPPPDGLPIEGLPQPGQ